MSRPRSLHEEVAAAAAAVLLMHRLVIKAGVPQCTCGAPLADGDMNAAHAVHAGAMIGRSVARMLAARNSKSPAENIRGAAAANF